ncbi:uncharacterized protein UBRO2_04150 [Ustilago bromivora]|nr:uncharacterized protein UBRO2_04150 [Ustilago bromivora]
MGELLSSRRLDSIWVSMDLLPALPTANTKSSPSDHAAVSISLRNSSAAETRGPGTWRLHRDIHLRPAFAERLRRFSAQLDLAIPLRNAPIQAWLDFKERTRTAAHNLSLEISSHLHLQQQPYLSLLAHIESIDIRAGPTARSTLVEALRRLKQMEIDLAHAASDLFVSRHNENMFRPTSWIIPRLESRSFAPMGEINKGRQTYTTVPDKLGAVERFYQALFTPRPWDLESETAAQTLLGVAVRCISNHTREQLERLFTIPELRDAMQHRQDSSAPGLDGLAYPILKLLGTPFLDRLSRMGNSLMAGHSLPPGLPRLRGVLLPKKGDLSSLSNYRPLSIADADIRLLGAAVSNRLQSAAQEVIPATQTGFILHRQSAFNVVALYLLQHAVHVGKLEKPIWVLNLDQQKAYDCVHREWLERVLDHYGFGPRFKAYVGELYRHPSL